VVERADDNEYTVAPHRRVGTRIRVSKRVVELCKRQDLDEKVKEELRKKLQAADWLVKAVEATGATR